jgi:hypothetical protein
MYESYKRAKTINLKYKDFKVNETQKGAIRDIIVTFCENIGASLVDYTEIKNLLTLYMKLLNASINTKKISDSSFEELLKENKNFPDLCTSMQRIRSFYKEDKTNEIYKTITNLKRLGAIKEGEVKEFVDSLLSPLLANVIEYYNKCPDNTTVTDARKYLENQLDSISDLTFTSDKIEIKEHKEDISKVATVSNIANSNNRAPFQDRINTSSPQTKSM